jgi:hypothetical protein
LPSFLKDSLADHGNLDQQLFSFRFHVLPCNVSAEKSAVSLMGLPLHVICHFYSVDFKNSLSFPSDSLTIICHGEDLFLKVHLGIY